MPEPSASHSEYNMYTCVSSRKFGIWRKFSQLTWSTYNNSQARAPGSFDKAQSSGYLWPHYNARKKKTTGRWRAKMLNVGRSSTPDCGFYVRGKSLLQQRWGISGTSLAPIRNPKCTQPPNRGILYPSLCHGHDIRRPTRTTRNHTNIQTSSPRSFANLGQYGQK